MLELKQIINMLKIESQKERVKFVSKVVGEIKWCKKCKRKPRRTSINLWDHSEKCLGCGKTISILRIEDFLTEETGDMRDGNQVDVECDPCECGAEWKIQENLSAYEEEVVFVCEKCGERFFNAERFFSHEAISKLKKI